MIQAPQPHDAAQKRLRGMLAQAGCATVPTLVFGLAFLAFAISSAQGGRSAPANFLPFLIPFVLVAGVMLAIGCYVLWRAIRAARGLRELGNGEIQTTNGTVQWTGRRYGIESSPKLELLQGQELMPGTYQFTYLPQSRYVIEAAPLSPGTTEQRAQVTSALGAVFGFTDEDLTGCRAGRLSPAHQQKLRSSNTRSNIVIGAVMALFILIGVATLVQPLLSGRFSAGQLLPALLFIAFPLVFFFAMRGGAQAIDKGDVATIEGPVTERRSTSGKNTTYYFQVGNMSFRVPYAAQTALVAGQTYRVYYLPGSKQLVGIEPV